MSDDVRTSMSPLDALYRAERPRILSLCAHITGETQEAEDATQETFALASRALPMFRGESSLLTWVLRIAVRVSVETRARRARRVWTQLSDELPSDDANPHTQFAAREEMRRLLQALDTLPVEQRAVLGLAAFDGLSHAEIASILGIAEGTVWSRLARARARLAALLDPPSP